MSCLLTTISILSKNCFLHIGCIVFVKRLLLSIVCLVKSTYFLHFIGYVHHLFCFLILIIDNQQNALELLAIYEICFFTIQWYLGLRPPPYLNKSVFDQKIQAKNASEFEQTLGVRSLGLGTEKSLVESKRTPRSISRERKEPSGAETHSADRFLIKTDRFLIKEKRKATAQPDSPPKKRKRREKKPKVELPSLI